MNRLVSRAVFGLVVLFALSTVFAETARSAGADVLTLTDGTTLTGELIGFSGLAGVSVRTSTGDATTVPTSRIVKIDATVSADFRRGVESFERGAQTGDAAEFRRALAAFRDARKSDERRWAKEWATAKIVETLVALGEDDAAADEFFLLCRLDPYSAFLPSIPLRWTNGRATATPGAANLTASAGTRGKLEETAAGWLDPKKNPTGKPNPVGRLLAASILLNSAKYKNAAVAALQELVVCKPPKTGTTPDSTSGANGSGVFDSSDSFAVGSVPDSTSGANGFGVADSSDDGGDSFDGVETEGARTCRTIALLATAQLWRLALVSKPSEREVERWGKTLERFPVETRLGPEYLVARGTDALRQNDETSANALLRIALASTTNRTLAERAALEAAAAFDRLGRKTNADRARAAARR